MTRVQTMVQLSDDLLADLDREAARCGRSRSAIVRAAIVAHLATSSEAAKVERYVEGYRRIPQGATDGWGDLGAEAQQATNETLQRLDAEDDAAGLAW